MLKTEFLIIGQGISGTWLSFFLEQEGREFLVIDREDALSASRVSAGLVNPVTGRRYATVWMAAELMPFVWDAYTMMGTNLGISAISQHNIIDFFPTPQMRDTFLKKLQEANSYVHSFPEQNKFNPDFDYEFGCGEIRPCYTAHLDLILPAWRQKLINENRLTVEDFATDELKIQPKGIEYRGINAQTLVFCDGVSSFANPYFNLLPFALNKGEALIVEIKDLPTQFIYKKGMLLVPLSQPGTWWVGSNYLWEYPDSSPTDEFRIATESLLKKWLKLPFKVLEHLSSIRPATVERRPFVGMHPIYPQLGLLNGMGTKGCSLAPFFAKQLTDHLLNKKPIDPDADVNRFARVLSRQN